MVNFRDPAVVARDFLSLVKLLHTVAGLYIWEFVTTLDYEWSFSVAVAHTAGQYGSIYSFTRVATLVAVILAIIAFDAQLTHTCQALITSHAIFAYFALATSQLLILLRIIAIWNRRRVVVATSIGVWVTNAVFLIQAISRLRSGTASPDSCKPKNIQISKLNIISTLVTDVALLLIMLVGLLQLRIRGVGMLSLGRLLWKQGIVWLCIATATGALPVIFVCLDLNGSISSLSLFYHLRLLIETPRNIRSVKNHVPSSLARRNINRFHTDVSLSDRLCLRIFRIVRHPSVPPLSSAYCGRYYGSTHETLQASGLPTSKVAQTSGAPIPLNRMEVAVHNSWIQHPATSTSDHGSQTDADKQANCKSNESISEENI
ncbi:hypothetical protein BC826DRAFT_1107697 [Russula brevipes]|nr:hypothetical protein BC826DRAFT_1107697 [Russula brevipes]